MATPKQHPRGPRRVLARLATSPLFLKGLATGLACLLVFGALLDRLEPTRQVSADADWQLGLAYHWTHGELAGRDFFFTYGPLSQLIATAGARLHVADDPISALPLIELGFQAVTLVVLFFVVMLVPALDWRGGAVVVLLVSLFHIPIHYPSYRVLALLIVAALAAYATLSGSPRRNLLLACAAGLAAFGAQLLSGELGVFAIATMVLVFGSEWLLGVLGLREERWTLRRTARLVLASIATVLGLNLLLSTVFVLGSPAWTSFFAYQRSILAVVSGYATTMGIDWQLAKGPTVALLLATLLVSARLAYDGAGHQDASSRVLLAFGLASLLSLKSAITRSDSGHIFLGFTPFFVTACCAGVVATMRRRQPTLWIAVAALLVAGWPLLSLEPLRQELRMATKPRVALRKLSRVRHFRVGPSSLLDPQMSRSASSDPLLPYPYQNHLAAALGRPLVSPILQAYAAHLPATQRAYVRALDTLRPHLEVFYGVDDLATIRIDGVQTMTRLPIITEFLLENFVPRSPTPSPKGYLLLEPRAEPSELRRAAVPGRQSESGSGALFRADSLVDCGYIGLTVEIGYPPGSSLVLRPGAMRVTVRSEETQLRQSRVLPLTRNGSFETFLSVVEPAEIGGLFAGSSRGPGWREVLLEPEEELLSVRPSRLALPRVSCLSLASAAGQPVGSAAEPTGQ